MEQHRPKNLLQGLGQGMGSLVTGIKDGVSGVFEKPMEEVNKQGWQGIFLGVF